MTPPRRLTMRSLLTDDRWMVRAFFTSYGPGITLAVLLGVAVVILVALGAVELVQWLAPSATTQAPR